MQVLEPKDLLKLGNRETTIHQAALRRGKIFLQLRLPRLLAERRQPAGDRLPLHHRQSRFGQPRERAEHDHEKNHGGHDDQPVADLRRGGLHARRTMREATAPVSILNVAKMCRLARMRGLV
jgi:hypothetical protein